MKIKTLYWKEPSSLELLGLAILAAIGHCLWPINGQQCLLLGVCYWLWTVAVYWMPKDELIITGQSHHKLGK